MNLKLGMVTLVSIVTTGIARLASAQPAPPPPPPPMAGDPTPAAPGAPGSYPASMIERPTMLNDGGTELDGSFSMSCFIGGTIGSALGCPNGLKLGDTIDLQLLARHSWGSFELFGGVVLNVAHKSGSGMEALDTVTAGVRIKPGSAPGDLKAQFLTFEPTASGYNIYEFRGTYEFKQAVAPQVAVLAEGGFAYDELTINDFMGDTNSSYIVGLLLDAGLQFAANPVITLEGGGHVWVPLTHSDNINDNINSLIDLYAAAYYTLGDGKFDLYGKFIIGDISNDASGQIQVGILARL